MQLSNELVQLLNWGYYKMTDAGRAAFHAAFEKAISDVVTEAFDDRELAAFHVEEMLSAVEGAAIQFSFALRQLLAWGIPKMLDRGASQFQLMMEASIKRVIESAFESCEIESFRISAMTWNTAARAAA